MAITHVGTDSHADLSAQGATTTITKPTGVTLTSSHVLVVVFGIDITSAPSGITPPAGWTRIGPAGGVSGGSGVSQVYLTAFWALGTVANLTFTNGDGSGPSQGWVCLAFSGCDTVTPIDVQDTTGNKNTGATSLSISSVTIVTANSWELLAASDWNTGTFTAPNFTVTDNAATSCMAALLYNTTPKSTGATGTVTLNDSASGTGQVIDGFAFALRPAGGAVIETMGWHASRWVFEEVPDEVIYG